MDTALLIKHERRAEAFTSRLDGSVVFFVGSLEALLKHSTKKLVTRLCDPEAWQNACAQEISVQGGMHKNGL
jgi:hypothetical protein